MKCQTDKHDFQPLIPMWHCEPEVHMVRWAQDMYASLLSYRRIRWNQFYISWKYEHFNTPIIWLIFSTIRKTENKIIYTVFVWLKEDSSGEVWDFGILTKIRGFLALKTNDPKDFSTLSFTLGSFAALKLLYKICQRHRQSWKTKQLSSSIQDSSEN